MTEDVQQAGTTDPWMAAMLAGDFERAWRVSDDLVRRGLHDPVWKGQSFAGQRVLIRCIHGLGDAIQFIRYARLLKQAGACAVYAQMHPPLVQLLSTAPGLDRAFGWEGSAGYDVDIEIMELPWAFRSQLHCLPAETPYLQAPAQDSRCAGRIGIVWNSSQWDLSRSVPLQLLQRLERWKPVSLQHGPEHTQAKGLEWLEYAGEQSSDLLDSAADVKSLGLLITVDTMLAHLAGALGVNVWVLLKYDADWRWMRDREDSPWYPTMRLFRQPAAGDWEGAIRKVELALAANGY